MTNMIPQTAAEAVANGAQLLDEKSPGWWRMISFDTLNLADCGRCVCGQLAHQEYAGQGFDVASRYRQYLIGKLGLDDIWTGKRNSATHGFGHGAHGFGHGATWNYRQLEEEWRRVIIARLEADALSDHKAPPVRSLTFT